MALKEKDAFIFEENNEINFFLYIKLNRNELARALPISYVDDPDKSYLVCIIDPDGRDFIGQSNKDEIQQNIRDKKMKNLFNDYSKLQQSFSGLTIEQYNHFKKFAKKQLKLKNN